MATANKGHRWSGIIHVEGVRDSQNRTTNRGALSWNLPFPLTDKRGGNLTDPPIIGAVDKVYRVGDFIHAEGWTTERLPSTPVSISADETTTSTTGNRMKVQSARAIEASLVDEAPYSACCISSLIFPSGGVDAMPKELAPQINATLARQNVHMGDHAETVTSAVGVDPDETLRDFAARTLTVGGTVVEEWYVIIRLSPLVEQENQIGPDPF